MEIGTISVVVHMRQGHWHTNLIIDSLEEIKTTLQQTFKRKLSMENYFDVPKI